MQIPPEVKTYKLHSSLIWFDENGILFSSPILNVTPSTNMEDIKKEMDILRGIIGKEKVCLVAESHPKSKPPAKEHRDFIAEEINSVIKALAVITNSPVSKMIANLFFGLKPPPYPTKMFSNQKDAVEWIKQYL
ncbi:MAG: hypothetical protein H0W61_09990 [Bacteroidetes bacterium]|nr:hypothetical protein [Bacteroidota bacterium]